VHVWLQYLAVIPAAVALTAWTYERAFGSTKAIGHHASDTGKKVINGENWSGLIKAEKCKTSSLP
jgi:hypothetical protein